MTLDSGWDCLDRLPLRSKRTEAERAEASRVRDSLLAETGRLARSNRREIYDRLTDGRTRPVRVDDLVYRAAELWPGLVPTREEVAREAERMQMDKDGREIQQGILVSELLSDPEIGAHLISSML
ncbi:MAG TPA: enoyl-CoA hydratase/isomerase family protein, partial [Vicinamibacteria bacterium]